MHLNGTTIVIWSRVGVQEVACRWECFHGLYSSIKLNTLSPVEISITAKIHMECHIRIPFE